MIDFTWLPSVEVASAFPFPLLKGLNGILEAIAPAGLVIILEASEI